MARLLSLSMSKHQILIAPIKKTRLSKIFNNERNVEGGWSSEVCSDSGIGTQMVNGILSRIGALTFKSMDLDNDGELVRRARNGDYSAFEMLFERHRVQAYRYAYNLVGGRRDDAEDLVQDAFIRAYQNLHRYREDAKFTTWLLRIVTNLSADRARMSSRRTALEQREAPDGLDWMTIGSLDDPIENMESIRRSAALRKAINSLPENHRRVIILREIEGREYDEIGEILGCSPGGAKLRALRARRALADRMKPFMEDERK
jgi:RNA polymerase sigma-70 factor, ECF subfamily